MFVRLPIEAREQAIKLRADLEEELRERRDSGLWKIEERVLARRTTRGS